MKSKEYSKILDKNKFYRFEDAIRILKSISNKNFNESIETSIKFNVIPKKNIVIKGFSLLKHGIGKSNNIAILNPAEKTDKYITLTDEDLLNLNKKKINFNILLTSPENVIKLSKLGKLLNGRKIMPDVKYGTITTDLLQTAFDFENKYLKFKMDKFYSLNLMIGKINFLEKDLKENLEKLIFDIKKSKPLTCKMISVKKIFVSSTMGPGIKIDIDSIDC